MKMPRLSGHLYFYYQIISAVTCTYFLTPLVTTAGPKIYPYPWQRELAIVKVAPSNIYQKYFDIFSPLTDSESNHNQR
jgi:hypothetical protein